MESALHQKASTLVRKLRAKRELPKSVFVGIIFGLLLVAPFWIIVLLIVRLVR
jgi:archaellum biogenesis protein FlaJ (TadC family)